MRAFFSPHTNISFDSHSTARLVFSHRSKHRAAQMGTEMGHETTFAALADVQARTELLNKDCEYYREVLAEVCTERDDHKARADRLQMQVESLLAQSSHWRAEFERVATVLDKAKQGQHIDTRIVEHLRAGDGTFVLAEHTADGLTTAYTPTVDVLRNMVLADLRRVETEALEAA